MDTKLTNSLKNREGSYILKLNDFLFFCLFVCSELIEELSGATDMKFGIHVEHVVPRSKTKEK